MDSPLDQLLASATIKGKEDKRYDNLIRIDLQDRRFYVGEIYAMGEPTETEGADQEISIIPYFSGYRDKDTLKVIYVNDYTSVTDERLELIIRQDQIVSATKFSFKAREEFHRAANPKKRTKTKASLKKQQRKA